MGDYLRRAYDEAERAASRGDSNATPTRQGGADLKAENAKLREELDAAKHDLQVFSANLARLGAENAKARPQEGGEQMSITDEPHGQLDTGYPHTLRPELHKALEAKGIDYWVAQGITFWNRDDGCECLAYGYQADGVPKLAIKVVGFTDPEQAIAATLGARTCKAVYKPTGVVCSECGGGGLTVPRRGVNALRNYCPNCGGSIKRI